MRMLIYGIAAFGSLTLLANAPVRAAADDAPVVVNTVVPADAKVWFDGVQTTQTGTQRRFVSPAIAPGHTYVYEVHVVAEGRKLDDTRTLRVRAGEEITLDFTGAQVRETRGRIAQPSDRANYGPPSYSSYYPAYSYPSYYRSYGPPRTLSQQSPFQGNSWSPWLRSIDYGGRQ